MLGEKKMQREDAKRRCKEYMAKRRWQREDGKGKTLKEFPTSDA